MIPNAIVEAKFQSLLAGLVAAGLLFMLKL